ncbi:hypothetical protein ACFZAE_37800 [Streptomyces scabiei]|uniref:hypothetical protein n=1 Tax=Streptomyces scabiei TaxID=1930 RepID=UPI0036F0AF64
MAKAAWRIAESPETRRPLLDSLAHPQFGHAGHLHRPDAGRPQAAAHGPRARRTLISVGDGTWRSWDATTHRLTG